MPLTPAMIRSSQLAETDTRSGRPSVRERSYSEETITPEVSLTVSAVLAAFTILSEDLSSLPLLLYERRGRNKFRAYGNRYYRLMHDQPNPEHTSMIFREFIIGHMLGWGNFFGQPIFDKRGDVVELWPLRPDRMRVERFKGERIYIYQMSNGKPRIFLSEEILHIPAFGFDGLIGYSRIALAKNAIGLSISAEKYGSKFYANDASVGVVYSHPSELSDKAYERLDKALAQRSGVDESHKSIILEEGMSIDRLGIPNDDAQFLETRKFQVSEVARIFRVPPHMIGDVERSTSWGTGIDSQEQGYVNHTLRPWAVRTEQALNTSLLLKQDRDTYYYEHLMEAFLRGDIETRYEAYVKAITNGFMSRNEARERENLNPRKGLDTMLQPMNMMTIDDGSSVGNDSGITPANALEPLWRDAIARVLKREENDLSGASKRWQAKGQQDEFEQWVDEFYNRDHLTFAMKQFRPLLDAQIRLFGLDTGPQMKNFVSGLLCARREQVKSMDAEQIEAGMNVYIRNAADEIISFVSDALTSITEEDSDE